MFKLINPIGHIDVVKEFNSDMSNFQTHINEANKIMENIRADQNYNAELLKKANEIMNNPRAAEEMQRVIENGASAPISQFTRVKVPEGFPDAPQTQTWWENFLHRGKVEPTGDNGIIGNGIDSIKSSLESISKFTDCINWIIANPYEAFKIAMFGLCDIARLLALVVCAASLIMAIFGHKEALKYIPISLTIYTLLRILVVIL